MIPRPATGAPSSSIALGRVRDARVRWLLERHTVTAAMLVALGWFPSKNKALRRLRRLVRRKRVRLVGTVARTGGRPEHVYCCFAPKGDQLLHEVELTALCLRLDVGEVRRGPHITDHAVRPDAELRINGLPYYLELDRGSMGYAQIVRRFRLYERCPHFVLWVCPTAERRDGFRERAALVRATALFTTFADAITDPHAAIWLDCAGGRVALPRQTRPTPTARGDR